jgi:hypothetical protein
MRSRLAIRERLGGACRVAQLLGGREDAPLVLERLDLAGPRIDTIDPG